MGTEYLSAVLIGTDQLRFEASLVMGMYEAVCEIVKASICQVSNVESIPS